MKLLVRVAKVFQNIGVGIMGSGITVARVMCGRNSVAPKTSAIIQSGSAARRARCGACLSSAVQALYEGGRKSSKRSPKCKGKKKMRIAIGEYRAPRERGMRVLKVFSQYPSIECAPQD